MNKSAFSFLLVVVVAGALAWLIVARDQKGHDVPPAFAEHLSLADAESRAGSTKPVLAFATASWCPPCREMKRATLQDPRVTKWILDNTIPAYVDVDHDAAGAQRLSVNGIPAFILLHNGREVMKHEGFLEADDFISWGSAALSQVSATPAR